MKKLLKAILVEEKREELKKNNIIIKNGIFKINEKQKNTLEKELERPFKKNYFSDKNEFIFNGVKEELEKHNYTFKTEEELEEELEKFIKELEEEEKKELEQKKKEEEKKSK